MSARYAKTAVENDDPLGRPWIKDLQYHSLKTRVGSASCGIWSVDRHFTGVAEACNFLDVRNAQGYGFCNHD